MSGEVLHNLTPNNDDSKTKLHQLLDIALEQQRQEMLEFIEAYEELKKNPEKRLIVSSFTVKETATTAVGDTKIDMTCTSPNALIVWKHCFATAIEKLKIRGHGFRTSETNISTKLDKRHVSAFLRFLSPLAQITDFEKGIFADTNGTTYFTAIQTLPELLDAALCLKLEAVDKKTESLTQFSMNFNDAEDWTIWQPCLIAALKMLKAPFITFQRSISTEYLAIDSNYVEKFLEYIAPLLQRTNFDKVNFADAQPEIIDLCSAIFKGKTVSTVSIVSFNPEYLQNHLFNSVLEFVRVVKPHNAIYSRSGHNEEVVNFIMPLAELVEAMCIAEVYQDENKQCPLRFNVIKEILSKKCEYLYVYGRCTVIARVEIEQLVQFLHHTGKKAALKLETDADPMSIRTGEFKVDVEYEEYGNNVEIEHLEVDPSRWEAFAEYF